MIKIGVFTAHHASRKIRTDIVEPCKIPIRFTHLESGNHIAFLPIGIGELTVHDARIHVAPFHNRKILTWPHSTFQNAIAGFFVLHGKLKTVFKGSSGLRNPNVAEKSHRQTGEKIVGLKARHVNVESVFGVIATLVLCENVGVDITNKPSVGGVHLNQRIRNALVVYLQTHKSTAQIGMNGAEGFTQFVDLEIGFLESQSVQYQWDRNEFLIFTWCDAHVTGKIVFVDIALQNKLN